ncbi:hypothetical protein CEXT_635131 [Caerostris extrusa]|uniref:Uncharacterized protein n=1 Tax=Caerostris extrusa TaxID=172846 RepID=A0AAV4UPJ3_CAEEX|nr:hypothetical protein CEXT_635131 [Caerostris extrusa]
MVFRQGMHEGTPPPFKMHHLRDDRTCYLWEQCPKSFLMMTDIPINEKCQVRNLNSISVEAFFIKVKCMTASVPAK